MAGRLESVLREELVRDDPKIDLINSAARKTSAFKVGTRLRAGLALPLRSAQSEEVAQQFASAVTWLWPLKRKYVYPRASGKLLDD